MEWEDIVKGYQHEKGEYVVLSDEDFRLANVEATQTIDIQASSSNRAKIPPPYFETPVLPVRRRSAAARSTRCCAKRWHVRTPWPSASW